MLVHVENCIVALHCSTRGSPGSWTQHTNSPVTRLLLTSPATLFSTSVFSLLPSSSVCCSSQCFPLEFFVSQLLWMPIFPQGMGCPCHSPGHVILEQSTQARDCWSHPTGDAWSPPHPWLCFWLDCELLEGWVQILVIPVSITHYVLDDNRCSVNTFRLKQKEQHLLVDLFEFHFIFLFWKPKMEWDGPNAMTRSYGKSVNINLFLSDCFHFTWLRLLWWNSHFVEWISDKDFL